MMSGNQIIMSRSLKRKIVIDGESSSETSQGTAKKNAQYSTGTTLSYSEATEEDIKIVFESEKIVLESDEANSEKEYLKLNTSGFKLDAGEYKNGFFKHSFLPSTRKRNNRYTRNDSKKSSLPIRDVELRLLNSGTALSDLGDIIQLTEYLTKQAEIGCYHRIQSGGCSRKLISRRDEQNLKKKYSQDELCIVHQPVKLLFPSGFSVITENPNIPSDSEIEIKSDSVRGNANLNDDSWDSSSANMSRQSENSHACSVINNSVYRLDIPLSSDNATNLSLQRKVSDCSSPLGEAIQDITNFNRTQKTTATESSVISSHFHTTSTDIAINKSILSLSNSNSKKNTVTDNLQHNSPVHLSVPVDDMQNGVINGAKTAATGKATIEKLTENYTLKETIESTKDGNEDSKKIDYRMAQPFYGKRIANRGVVLTKMKFIPPKHKISTKKTFEVNRNLNPNLEEIHALIKDPDINIDLSRLHSDGNTHKCIDSSRNGPHKSLGISSHSDLSITSFEDEHTTPRNSNCQVYAGNNTKQNTGLPHAPVSTTSPVLINNNMPGQGTVLNAYVPPANFMPRTVSHLNSLSISGGHRTSEYDVNRFPCFPLAPTYAVQHPFQPYASPRTPTSIHPLQLQSYMHPRFLTPVVHPPQLAFQTYVDPRNQAGSFMLHNSFDSASEIESERMNEDSNNYTPPINTACSQGTTVMLPPNTPRDTAISSSFANDVSSKCFDKEKDASEIQVSNRKCFPKTSSNSDFASSPSFKTFVAHTDEISGKPKCLVPSHMKYCIGTKSFKTEDVRLLILEWNVDSIIDRINNQESPPVYCNFKKLSSSYESFEDYYNTLFPLLMLETWERVCTSLSRLNITKPFSAEIFSYSVEKDHVLVKCKTVYNADPYSHPEAGSIVLVNYGTKSIEHTVKIFGYLIQSKLRPFDPETDAEICNYDTQHADTEPYTFPVLMFTFISAYDSDHINKQVPIRIQVLYALKYNLKQHDALLLVKNSPFEKYILKPNTEGLLRFSLNSENSEEKISKCVEKVMEKISAPHPIPIITMIKTNTDSDHLKIIPLLIQKIKNNCNNMKVLVCVRTRKTIADIASKLTSQPDLRLLILTERSNVCRKFQKLIYDDFLKKKIKHIPVEINELEEEVFKIKKEIVLDSDVFISWARDIHNDSIARALSETKSIDNMCCIIDEAHSFTEPETLIPTLYGIKKLVLIGNIHTKAKVLSETAITHDFDKSYFHRAISSEL